MAVDNSEGINKIKSKVSTIKTVKREKAQLRKEKRRLLSAKLDEEKTKRVKQVKDFKKNVKKEITNIYDDLIEIFKQTKDDVQDEYVNQKKNFSKKKDDFKNRRKEKNKRFIKKLDPTSGDTIISTVKSSNTYRDLGGILFLAVQNTKAKIKNQLIEDIISTIGCSEEQSYDNMLSTPIYIKLKNIDLFTILKTSPDDQYGKLNYEKEISQNGDIPYSMNRQLYTRLLSPQSFSQEYGQSFISSSGSELFDIQYVDNYIDQNNIQQYGDFFKITLKSQLNNRTKVSDFLNDYYTSIDVFNLDSLMSTIYGQIFGPISVGITTSQEELVQFTKFLKIVKRLMGLCTDTTQKIDISGSGKLSDLDLIDDSFFEISSSEGRDIEETVNRKINNLVTFEDCSTLNLPANIPATAAVLNDIISENTATGKINLFFNGIDDLSTDQTWQDDGAGGLNIPTSIITDVVSNMPMLLFKTILTPKVMLGFMIMVKSFIGNTLDFEDLSDFLKKFKKFVLKFTRNIIGIFIEELANEIKKNIKRLVESVIKDIRNEIKNKKIKMYISILEVLLIAGKGVLDYRECKSVIDEILKLLNLIG